MISKTYRRILVGCTILIGHSSLGEAQSVPVYLDESKPVEQRIEDALARMTLDCPGPDDARREDRRDPCTV